MSRRRRALLLSLALAPALPAADVPADAPRPGQRVSEAPPPAAPEDTPVDPGAPIPARAVPPPVPEAEAVEVRREPSPGAPALPPSQFNPDPGAAKSSPPPSESPFFQTNQVEFARPELAPLPSDQALPREGVETVRFVPVEPAAPSESAASSTTAPLPPDLALPREGVRENLPRESHWHAPEVYPLSQDGEGVPAHARPAPDRWRDTGFTPWRRYTSGDTSEIPYAHAEPEVWHYYRQSLLKGDLPIHGQDVFLALTASAELIYEDRKLTVPSGASAASPGAADFFGRSRSELFVSNVALDFLLFKGETVFKPADWVLRLKPVFNINHVDFQEAGIVSPNPGGPGGGGGSGGLSSGATARTRDYVALQEAFFEIHLADISPNYDFVALKVGNQVFNSDFRGFVFNDTNLGARLFGNHEANRTQFNLALFDLREKDTNSELNTFDSRDQRVFVANLYRQDFVWLGYTAQLSYHGNFDHGGTHYDRNGGIVRPAPLGSPVPHQVQTHYLGWAGDGHIGRWNVSHALYVVGGKDDFNGLAGRETDVFAQMAALEVSYDRDWVRYKASAFFASGDSDPTDGLATGFDSIVDNVNFTGGPFSYYVRQGFNLAGTAVGVKQRFSLLPNLRTSKTQGQANHVNPGLLVLGVGADLELTPRLRSFLSANYIRFATAEPIKTALLTDDVDETFGLDLGIGFQWRPLLTDNIIASFGCGFLLPGEGFRDIYRSTQPVVPGFTTAGPRVDEWLYSAIAAVTFTY